MSAGSDTTRCPSWPATASRRLLIADVEAAGDAGRVVARGTGTFMRSDIRLSPAIGYR
jgi:acyl-coenzyme A thioesterase PaaI-like protein